MHVRIYLMPFFFFNRYIICQKLHLGTEAVQEYMKAINYKLNELKNNSSQLDILEVSCKALYIAVCSNVSYKMHFLVPFYELCISVNTDNRSCRNFFKIVYTLCMTLHYQTNKTLELKKYDYFDFNVNRCECIKEFSRVCCYLSHRRNS